MAKEHSSSSSTFVSVKSKREIYYKLDNMTRQLETLSLALSSSQNSLVTGMHLIFEEEVVVVTLEHVERNNVIVGIVEKIITYYNVIRLC